MAYLGPPPAEINVSVRGGFSSGGSTGEGSPSKFPQVDGRIYFLVAVKFTAASFFKASTGDSKTVC